MSPSTTVTLPSEARLPGLFSFTVSQDVCVSRLDIPVSHDAWDNVRLSSALRELGGLRHVAVDLGGRYLTNDQIALLMPLRAALEKHDGHLALFNVDPQTLANLRIQNLTQLIDVYPDEAAFMRAHRLAFRPSAEDTARVRDRAVEALARLDRQAASATYNIWLPPPAFPGPLLTKTQYDGWEILHINAPKILEESPDARRLAAELREMKRPGARVIIDCEAVQFVGADAIGSLFSLAAYLREYEGELRLCSLNPPVAEKLSIAGFLLRRAAYRSLSEALSANAAAPPRDWQI